MNLEKLLISIILINLSCTNKIEKVDTNIKTIEANVSEKRNKIDRRLLDSIKVYSHQLHNEKHYDNKRLFIIDLFQETKEITVRISAREYMPELLHNDYFDGMIFIDSFNIVIYDKRKTTDIKLYDSSELNLDTILSFYPNIKDIENGKYSPIYPSMSFKW